MTKLILHCYLLLAVTLFFGEIGGAEAATVTRVVAFDYDPTTGLLTKEIVEPDNSELCIAIVAGYDPFGNKTTITSRNCNGTVGTSPGINNEAAAPTTGSLAIIEPRVVTSIYNDGQARFPTTIKNALNQTETSVFDARLGLITSLTGPNDLTTTWTYDNFGRQLTETRADGTSRTTNYALCVPSCPSGGIYTITTAETGAPTTKMTYDMLGRIIRADMQGMDGTYLYSLVEYNSYGLISRKSVPTKVGGPSPVWTTYNYDNFRRISSVTAPDNSIVTVTYNGLIQSVQNAVGQTRTITKNSKGQLISVTDADGNTISYAYDPIGNLIKTTDALGNVTTITYDVRGRKTGMNDPDQGAWSYSYDALNQLKRQTDAKFQMVNFIYDKLGRMTRREEPDLLSTWTYDTCDPSLNPAGKCIGKPVTEASDNGYARTYLYDALGRPTSELDNVDIGYGVTKSYDSAGRVASLVYPTGFSVSNVYSATGYLSEVRNSSTNGLYWRADSTDAQGRVTQETYGNGIVTNRTYDVNTGRLTQIAAGPAGSISNQSFVYDPIGNLTQRYDGATGLNESFGYDNLNRITATTAAAVSGINTTSVTIAYNAIGNITSKSDVGTYTYGVLVGGVLSKPHAVSSITMNDGLTNYATYQYDSNGNQSSGAGRIISLNSWDMPNSITGSSPGKSTPTGTTSSMFQFVYNASHERVKEVLPDGTIIYNVSPRLDTGIHVEKRMSPSTAVQYSYSLYAGSMPFGTVTNTTFTAPGESTPTVISQTRYFHEDILGSIVAVTDGSGNVLERRSFDAWGKRRNLNGTAMSNAFVTPEERHGYTGHQEMNELGLIHMNGRIYDQAINRFTSVDPVIQFLTDMQSFNAYSYVTNNPLVAIDPSGFTKVCETLPQPNCDEPVRITIPTINVPSTPPPPPEIYGCSTCSFMTNVQTGYGNMLGGYGSGVGGAGSGQSGVGNANSNRQRLSATANSSNGTNSSVLSYSQESGMFSVSLSDVQMAADALTFVPGLNLLGGLTSAGIDTAQGNYGMAALGIVSMVPGIGEFGAAARVAAKSKILSANKIAGKSAELRARSDLIAEGNVILGSQVSVKTAEGRRVIDHLILTPEAEIFAIEVKSGGAVRNSAQVRKDAALARDGGKFVGENASIAKAQGLDDIPIKTIIRKY